jgi:flagellar basal-body rod protein FlgB
MTDFLFRGIQNLEQGLHTTWERHERIAENIANADTPGYRSSREAFEAELAAALDRFAPPLRTTRPGHQAAAAPYHPSAVPGPAGTRMRLDGSNVDIEKEMTALAQNTLLYNALVQKISKEFGRIRMAVQEGRR